MAITELICEILGGIIAGGIILRKVLRVPRAIVAWALRLLELLESINRGLGPVKRELLNHELRIRQLEKARAS